MPPQWPNLVLSSHVPYIELDVLVGNCLDVEPDGWYGGDILIELEFVEDSCRHCG